MFEKGLIIIVGLTIVLLVTITSSSGITDALMVPYSAPSKAAAAAGGGLTTGTCAFLATRTRTRAITTQHSRLYSQQGKDQAARSDLPDLPGPNEVSEEDIISLFSLWNNALATCEPKIVAKRYAKDAVLLPASSDDLRMDPESIIDYYQTYLLRKPRKRVLERRIKIGYGWAQDVGICEVTFRAENNAHMRARYSFMYVWENNQWRIQHHHSSVMPEHTPPSEMTVDRIKNLFHLWNDALDTLNAETVARRFTKNAVVLPTISDIPRTDYESIKAYYEEFLQYKPQARIVESHVTIGSDWAKDVGIYEITLGVDGTKTMARYSFDYAFEGGHWLISHQHSSSMPQNTWKMTVGKGSSPPPSSYVDTTSSSSSSSSSSTSSSTSRLSEEGVRELFGKWKQALATQNANQIAELYAQDAVLMPTVSDTPLVGRSAIQDFYGSYVLNNPQVEILQSFVTINNDSTWCKDMGVYQFTLGRKKKNTFQIQERYSFLYVMEDGEWKISHHHSSAVPEGVQTAARMASGQDGEDPNWQ